MPTGRSNSRRHPTSGRLAENCSNQNLSLTEHCRDDRIGIREMSNSRSGQSVLADEKAATSERHVYATANSRIAGDCADSHV